LLIQSGPTWVKVALGIFVSISTLGALVPMAALALGLVAPNAADISDEWFRKSLPLLVLVPAGMLCSFVFAWGYETWRLRSVWKPIKAGLTHAFLIIIVVVHIVGSL